MSRISSASASRKGARERRQWMPKGSPACSVRTECQGPAATQTKYVESSGVVAAFQRPSACCSVLPLARTVQPSGALTLTSKTALRSGWSKAAKTRWTSSMKSWV